MADKQKTIDIIFGGIDKTGSAVSSVGKNLQSLESSVGSVTGPLADITGGILKLDAALLAAGVGLTAYAINIADNFGTSFAEIATLIGQPASSLGEFKDQIQAYAEGSSASFEEITSATYNAISAGVDYSESLGLMAVAEKLSIAGRADLGITTKALVSTMNAFGAEMSEAEAYSDIFFTTVQKGQTTLPELADSIGTVAPLAAQAGISFGELGAAVAAITAGAGISTTEAMTALKGTISNIIKPSKEAADTAKELGIDFSAAALESKGLAGVLEEVKEATGGNVEKMGLLFGNVRALSAVLPLTGTASEKFAIVLDAMEKSAGNTGIAAKELETDLAKLGQTLKNNVTSAFINFGDNLTDETAGIITSMSNMFQSLGNEIKLDDGAFSEIIGQLENVFKDIESKFSIMAENLPAALDGLDFSDMVKAFDGLGLELGEAFEAIFGNVDLTTVEGLESALQTVVDAFTSLINISTGIIDGLEPLFDLISTGVGTFKELSEEEKKSVGGLLGLSTAINTLLPAMGALGTGLTAVGGGLATLAGAKGLSALTSNLGGLSTIASAAGKTGLVGLAVFGAGGFGAGVGAGFNSLFELFAGASLGSKLYDWFGPESSDLIDQFSKEMEKSAGAVKDLEAAQVSANVTAQLSAQAKDLDIDALQKLTDEMLNAKGAQSEYGETLEATADSQEKNAGALAKVSEAISIGGEAVAKASESTIELAKNSENLSIEYDQATGKINSWSGAMTTNGKALDSQAEKTKEALKQTEEYQLKLLELSSDERIANIEANVSLNIAQLEADTKVAVAIIESLGTSVQSTGDLIGALFGSLENASRSDQIAITKQIAEENRRRDEALSQQKELTQAQIELIRKKTDAMSRGDSLIKVEAANVSPHIEAFMFEILGAVQLRANQEGLDFLIGAT